MRDFNRLSRIRTLYSWRAWMLGYWYWVHVCLTLMKYVTMWRPICIARWCTSAPSYSSYTWYSWLIVFLVLECIIFYYFLENSSARLCNLIRSLRDEDPGRTSISCFGGVGTRKLGNSDLEFTVSICLFIFNDLWVRWYNMKKNSAKYSL